MRLTHLKLSGFKSFVDPSTIPVPGQLVGVVGPNGCGKSNIIDAVRWVLGESRASALRGESMQDVIFNGSSLRKPVSRASVELLFDNSLGRATGQWSQYAEISVKRVLTREGDSSYYINNQQVRRRDITDMFLGTGLGPRAYAIIEQGMISRIIEAKPEELRVFLEEAAGVSKYKERRRETENRIADTRENLTRVEDIRRELETQLNKLESQAEIARTFRELQARLTTSQNQLWLLRRNDAARESERLAKQIDEITNRLEEETAKLRDAEKRLEAMRADHYQAGDAVHAAQAELYAVNAEVSRLEAEIRYARENRARIEAQITQNENEHGQGAARSAELAAALEMWVAREQESGQLVAARQAALVAVREAIPGEEAHLAETVHALETARTHLGAAEQKFQIEQAHLGHAEKTLAALATRTERLSSERAAMTAPDMALLQMQNAELEAARVRLQEAKERLAVRQEEIADLEQARLDAAARVQTATTEQASLAARLAALRQVQSAAAPAGKLSDWLVRFGLDATQPIWQRLAIADGWDTALEAVLRERLQALPLDAGAAGLIERAAGDPPPQKVALFHTAAATLELAATTFKRMAELVTLRDPGIGAVVNEWLADVFVSEHAPQESDWAGLAAGSVIVNRAGHIFSRHGVSLHAPDADGQHGLMAREREIETLQAQAGNLEGALESAKAALEQAQGTLVAGRTALEDLRHEVDALRQAEQQLQVESLKLAETSNRYNERQNQITAELEEIRGQIQSEESEQMQAQENLESCRQSIDTARAALQQAAEIHRDAQARLEAARHKLKEAELAAQEAAFNQRQCSAKIEEVQQMQSALDDQIKRAAEALQRLRAELGNDPETGLQAQLQAALELRVIRETTIAELRNALESATSALRAVDEERLSAEQKLGPMRDQLGELKLKQQAAQLNSEQFALQLSEANADLAEIEATLTDDLKPSALQGAITRLQNEINSLGAVNLAALDELETSRARKTFLDEQATDLTIALETLEDAIHRIDRETRALLQNTFDQVNEHFGKIFPALFGGGDARLVMSGEEILDAGVQVMAHPPGKKNSSIHLLSGGEKALTAISLVFSMFQLNPAPFCLLDEVDAPLDDSNTERFCELVKKMSVGTQFMYISHNKITMEMASQLIGVTMQEQGVSRVVAVDIEEALKMREQAAA